MPVTMARPHRRPRAAALLTVAALLASLAAFASGAVAPAAAVTGASLSVVQSVDRATITRAGEKVTYGVLITNTGDREVFSVKAKRNNFIGPFRPMDCPKAVNGTLDLLPGDSATCTDVYTTTEADVGTYKGLLSGAVVEGEYQPGPGQPRVALDPASDPGGCWAPSGRLLPCLVPASKPTTTPLQRTSLVPLSNCGFLGCLPDPVTIADANAAGGSFSTIGALALSATGACSPLTAVNAFAADPGFDVATQTPASNQWGLPHTDSTFKTWLGANTVNPGYGCNATAYLNGQKGTATAGSKPGCNTNLVQSPCAQPTWKIPGAADEGGNPKAATTCTIGSKAPYLDHPAQASGASVPGVMCLGRASATGPGASVVAVGVPTPTVTLPVSCHFISARPARIAGGYLADGSIWGINSIVQKDADNTAAREGVGLDGDHTVCHVEAQTSQDGQTWSPIPGASVDLDTCAPTGGACAAPTTTGEVMADFANLVLPLKRAQQYVRVYYSFWVQHGVYVADRLQKSDPGLTFGNTGSAPVGPIGSNYCESANSQLNTQYGTARKACAGFDRSSNPLGGDFASGFLTKLGGQKAPNSTPALGSTFGPAVGATPALQVNVQPTAMVQTSAVLQRIVYAPPGARSTQTYNDSTKATSEIGVQYGRSDSNISAASTSLNKALSVNASVGSTVSLGVNLSNSDTWSKEAKSMQTRDSASGRTSVIEAESGNAWNVLHNNRCAGELDDYSCNQDRTVQSSAGGVSATNTFDGLVPSWANDLLVLRANPHFAVWNFASCSSGLPAASGATTVCPAGATIDEDTGVAAAGSGGEVNVTVGDLMPCVLGKGDFVLGDLRLSQSQCGSLVGQDPFAATALGLTPTPPGQFPGQAVNPAAVLGDSGSDTPLISATSQSPNTSVHTTADYTLTNTDTTEYSEGGSMNSEVTSVRRNEQAIGASTGISLPLVSIGGSATFTYGSEDTAGAGVAFTYTSVTKDQQSSTRHTKVDWWDPWSYISSRGYWDARFYSVMYQSTNGTSASTTPGFPKVTGAVHQNMGSYVKVTVTGTGFLNGPSQVRYCQNPATSDTCKYYPAHPSANAPAPPLPCSCAKLAIAGELTAEIPLSDISVTPSASNVALAVVTQAGSSTPFVPSFVGTPPKPYAPFASWSAFVKRQFVDLTAKEPSSSALSSWVSALSAGTKAKGDLDDALRRSSENTTNVDPTARLYRAFLGRGPDAGGLKFWIERRRSGQWSLVKMADYFAGSKEFKARYGQLTNRQFMLRIYTDVMGRPADAAGVDFWTDQLDTKKRTRGGVMVGFSESKEYKGRQAQNTDASVAHILLLGTSPSTVVALDWTSRQKAGTSHAALLSELLDSTGYAKHVTG